MARITRVKSAQQRYATVPVIDPETGLPKRTPVMRNGVQRTTKRGTPVFMTVTKADKTRPLPNLRCDWPGCAHEDREIKPGQAYKHITPKSGPYGGVQRNRHADHPDWQVWDYSYSLSAQTARIAYDFSNALDGAETPEDVESSLQEAAEAVREIAEAKRESAQNIEDGFGHETQQSEELNSTADELDTWADEIEGADVPDLPEPEETDCEECGGSGEVEVDVEGSDEPNVEPCDECDGTGQVTPDEPTDEQMDEWRDEVRESLSIVDECPV